jgi:hypothetical protein
MYAMNRVIAKVVALCGLILLTVPVPGSAADEPPSCPPGEAPSAGPLGWICIPATDPGGGGGPGSQGPGGGSTTGGSSSCHDASGAAIPCSNGAGTWSPANQCYAFAIVPQPPLGDPMWEGHPPAEGSVWGCDRTVAVPDNTWFVPGRDAPPDPSQLARSVVEAMPLVKPTVNMAPEPPLMTYVGLQTWLWMDEEQWSSVTGSATAGATTVTVVAEPVRVTWNLGDGVKTCGSAGREWRRGMSSVEETDCSYAFQHVSDFEPSGVFEVSAVISYAVNWTCAGNCLATAGTLGEVPGATSEGVAIRVGERQSVVIR